MREKYDEAELEVVVFESEDIITESEEDDTSIQG